MICHANTNPELKWLYQHPTKSSPSKNLLLETNEDLSLMMEGSVRQKDTIINTRACGVQSDAPQKASRPQSMQPWVSPNMVKGPLQVWPK